MMVILSKATVTIIKIKSVYVRGNMIVLYYPLHTYCHVFNLNCNKGKDKFIISLLT